VTAVNHACPIELRHPDLKPAALLKTAINSTQAETLHTLDRLGWGLRVLRTLADGATSAVVNDPDQRAYAVIEPDGVLVKHAPLRFCRGWQLGGLSPDANEVRTWRRSAKPQ
jgi:hypothetical protein